MLQYPQIEPIAFHVGSFSVHWYGIMYLIGFLTAWSLGMWRARKPESGWTPAQVGDLIFYCAVGVIVGGRLGYVLFYDFSNFITHPLSLFKIWQGGMAFHGGLIGVMVAIWFYGRRHHKSFFEVGDFLAPLVPIGLGFGRLGNFINGELVGRITDMPWGMLFPNAGPFARHPSQLYEALLEGLVLFLILWIFSAKRRPVMSVSGLFLICYGVFRIFIEFFRQPDWNVGYVAFGWVTEGQLLSIPMVVLGLALFILAYRKKGSLSC